MKRLFFTAASIAAIVFAAGSAAAYTSYQYTYYDKDGNGLIESNEFDTYVYNTLDMDRDNLVSSDEWNYYATVTTRAAPDIDYRTFDVWDVNSDKFLDRNEVQTLVRETKYYTVYDIDRSNTIDGNEYAIGQFNRYDLNMDGTITAEEWLAVHP